MGNCVSVSVSAEAGDPNAVPSPARRGGVGVKVASFRDKDASGLSPSRRRQGGAKVAPGGAQAGAGSLWESELGSSSWTGPTKFFDPKCKSLHGAKPSGHSPPLRSPPCDPYPCGSPVPRLSASGSVTSASSSGNSLFPEASLHEDYSVGQKLGAGRFGPVLACTRRGDGAQFACKVISSEQGARDATREVEVLRQLRGQDGVVQLESVYLQRPGSTPRRGAGAGPWGRVGSKREKQAPRQGKGGSGWRLGSPALGGNTCAETALPDVEVEEVQIIMERCYGGTLAERLKEKGHLPEQEALRVLRSVLRTVELLHAQGFIYRDIKDSNFLFKTKDADSPVVAIDFGLTVPYKQGEVLEEVAGSPLYIAPEVVRRAYGPQCDVWSAGVLFYQLLCGRHPFERGSVTAVLKAVTTDGVLDLESVPWPSVSESTKQLLTAMLTRDPEARPTPAQLLLLLDTVDGQLLNKLPPSGDVSCQTRSEEATAMGGHAN